MFYFIFDHVIINTILLVLPFTALCYSSSYLNHVDNESEISHIHRK